MRNFIIAVFAFAIIGCSSKSEMLIIQKPQIDAQSATLFTEVMRVPLDCSECNGKGRGVFINGAFYKSDVAIKCCLNKNLIDTDVAFKKVYLHRIVDFRDSPKAIYYTKKNGQQVVVFNSTSRPEVLFYMFLEQELKSRGIVVVDTQTSPYTYKLDFFIKNIRGDYDRSSEILSGKLSGELKISNINKNKTLQINTTQEVTKLFANKQQDFDFFISLLAKQAANKVAEIITKF